jgi:CBS domain containing-hemolysin-like protein
LDLRTVMRPPRFIPETLPISRLLAHFQAAKQHLAFVVDEYGALSGIVTLENVLERIVGSVEDEFDAERPEIVPDGPNQYIVDGRSPLESANRLLGLAWDSRDVDTVSGFIMQRLGRVPAIGDRLLIGGVTAEVLQVRGSRATRVRLTLPAGRAE